MQASVPWSHARGELGAVKRRVADVFDDFYRSMPPEEQERLRVAIVQYPYADKVVDAGHPYWPNKIEVPNEFIACGSLPFGFILENCCEVYDYSLTAEALEQVSTALLEPGETIGAFELADFLTEVPNPQRPEWNIAAEQFRYTRFRT